MGLLLIVSASVGVVIWAVVRHLSKRDRWLANLSHYEYAEWTRGVDLPRWKLPKERN